ncbi:hypothetical protein [Herbaspirillum sp.]|uniref:hypothetical protein n=1 Tax=Herbaspirillum TaxID=963 RepID=UPI00258C796C|nr:hypothetical protein [Herbaspirillum sp.]MCP3657424.1 hypothetical protein [Herbaspirillum sp.]MCP3946143.1 hypothetical protein [Herbaspirillum sp.]MCP4032459.1 hypothetical protein [Herbaspirillum sp.]MCP4558111.1 hypothetical protein [Herbaspirillum sp.]
MAFKFKSSLIAGAIFIWAIVLGAALMNNPSLSGAKSRLVIMKEEMDALLGQGGRVVDAEESAKYGGALLARLIGDEGWSRLLLQRYQETLVSRGWKRIQDTPILYCKDEILIKLQPNAGVTNGVGTNYIGMTYDASTIKRCNS